MRKFSMRLGDLLDLAERHTPTLMYNVYAGEVVEADASLQAYDDFDEDLDDDDDEDDDDDLDDDLDDWDDDEDDDWDDDEDDEDEDWDV